MTKTIYAETYKAPGLKIKSHCLPTLPSAAPGFIVTEAYILKAGSVERGGKRLEFQDVRIYMADEGTDPAPVAPEEEGKQ